MLVSLFGRGLSQLRRFDAAVSFPFFVSSLLLCSFWSTAKERFDCSYTGLVVLSADSWSEARRALNSEFDGISTSNGQVCRCLCCSIKVLVPGQESDTGTAKMSQICERVCKERSKYDTPTTRYDHFPSASQLPRNEQTPESPQSH